MPCELVALIGAFAPLFSRRRCGATGRGAAGRGSARTVARGRAPGWRGPQGQAWEGACGAGQWQGPVKQRAPLGLETPRHWADKAVARTPPGGLGR